MMTREQIGKLVLDVQDAFFDEPGLALTPRQAQQRFDADEATCREVLAVLADARVLTQRRDDSYALLLAHAA
jgi:hypothetical protein